jgi:hypothetical protein
MIYGIKALTFASWGQRFDYRTADEWLTCIAGLGLTRAVAVSEALLTVSVPLPAAPTVPRFATPCPGSSMTAQWAR